jgi:hypothetical protein
MEISDVRRRVRASLDGAKRNLATRRTLMDEASREYPKFLDNVAAPLFRQVAAILKAEGHTFGVFTPTGGVRLMSDRHTDDFLELTLDVSGDAPLVVGRIRRMRGSRVTESERPLGSGAIRDLTEGDVLDFLAEGIGPFVER